MMWNFLVSGLLTGTTVVLYDGSPGYPDVSAQWRVAEQTGATLYGTSAAYVMACRKADIHPAATSTSPGSSASPPPAPAPARRLPLAPRRGCRGPLDRLRQRRHRRLLLLRRSRPHPPGPHRRTQAPCLGTDLQSWDPSGKPLINEVGELVVTNPLPSMPIRFWNDPDGSRYHDSYFDMYPGVWRHGDWITITDHGSVIIHGRSDSTLNRQGVRMGSADIYEAVERLPEIRESLVIGLEEPDGGYWMPLFVHLAEGATLDDDLRAAIKQTIRDNLSAPRPGRGHRGPLPSRTPSPASASRFRSSACSRAPNWPRRSTRAPSTTSTSSTSTR